MATDQRWHGVMPEVADLDYFDPSVTMPGPPLMLQCLDDFLLHSEVPRGTSMSINAWTQSEKTR